MTIPPDGSQWAEATSKILYRIASWLLIGMGLLTGFGAIISIPNSLGTSEIGGTLLLLFFTVLFVVSGYVVSPNNEHQFQRTHAYSTFGPTSIVEQRAIGLNENCEEHCVVCDSKVQQGLVRRFREELVIAGLSFRSTISGHNYYCLPCAKAELDMGDIDESSESDETIKTVSNRSG